MKIKIDVFGLKKWYKQLLDENFYKFLISLGLLASAPVIASVLFDYIVIYGNGRLWLLLMENSKIIKIAVVGPET